MLTSFTCPINILTLRKIARSYCSAKLSHHYPFRLSQSFRNSKLVLNIATKASIGINSGTESSSNNSSNKHKRPKHKRFISKVGKAFIAVSAVIFVASIALNAALSYFHLYFNVSESLPYGLYKITYINKQGLNPFAFSGNHDEAQEGRAMVATDSSAMVATDSSAMLATDASAMEATDSSAMVATDASAMIATDASAMEATDSSAVVATDASAMVATDASASVGVADDMTVADGEDRAGLTDSNNYSLELVSDIGYSLDRGMLVLACLPDEVAKLAYERNYIASGKCKGGYAPVGKYIQALAGDEVRFTSEGIFVNGKLLEHSKPYEMDGEGRPMPVLQQEMVLPKDELVLANSYAGSFDSRYYGPIPIRYVVGTLKPVLTF